MHLKVVVTAIAVTAAMGLLALPADAAPKNKRVTDARGYTVFTTHGKSGRTHTRIIIQKRSYLDPGTAALPSDRNKLDYVELPNQWASGVLDNTAFGDNQTALPGPFTLPSSQNPWLGY